VWREGETIETGVKAQIWDVLTDGMPVVVTSHERLDGDAVGAALALWHGLRQAGVACAQVYEPPVPAVFGFLPGLDGQVELPEGLPERFHLVVVDCASLDRVGRLAGYAGRAVTTINIDHHLTNDAFGDINYVRPDASPSGELVYRILASAGAPIDADIAQCLYTAILTDTGRFSYANTTATVLEVCGRLLEAGVRPWEVSAKLYDSPPEQLVRLKGATLSTLQLAADGRIATMQITEQMFRDCGARSIDTQGFSDLPLAVAGVKASALLKEITPEGRPPYVKVSLRSRASSDDVDVCAVAEAFGGGGHRRAAGCEFTCALAEARAVVVERLCRRLDP